MVKLAEGWFDMGIKDIVGAFGILPRMAVKAYDKQKDKADALEAENAMYKEANQAREPRLVGMKKGGKVSSASKRADGCATKGKTRGKMV